MRSVAVAATATGARSSVLTDLAEGFSDLFRTGWLFASLAFATLYVLVLIGPIEVLLPFAVREPGRWRSEQLRPRTGRIRHRWGRRFHPLLYLATAAPLPDGDDPAVGVPGPHRWC
jgi:hypothetical protein